MTRDQVPYVRPLGWRYPEQIEPMRQGFSRRFWLFVGSYVAAVAVAGAVTLWALLK